MQPTIIFLISIFVLNPIISIGQDVQWAYELIGFSSEYTSQEYSAKQVLGEPNALPSGGQSAVAWSPYWANRGIEWIHVGFQNPIQIKQIAIGESLNPGTVTKVFTYDTRGKEYLVYNQDKVERTNETAKILHIILPLTDYKCTSVKIELNTKWIYGYNHIDAIGISASDQPIKARINVANMDFLSQPENLGTNVNSPYGEVHPIISPDGKTLYFTRKLHPQNLGTEKRDDIWVSTQEGNGWGLASNIGQPLNSIGHNFINAISPDGNKAFIGGTYGNHEGSDRLYTSNRMANGWSTPVEIKIDDYYNLAEYNSFHMGVDGKTMVMALKRNDSYGYKDMYVSFLKSSGSWTAPKHMGPIINTAGDEVTPFLAADGVTLYFSTNGISGYGSNDIFSTKRLDDSWTNWSKPLNLGPVINSSEWEAYYSVPASGEYAYFTSNKNSVGEGDIFRIRLEEIQKPDIVGLIKGKVFDASTLLPIAADIEYELMPTEENAGFARSSESNGLYQVVLPAGKLYKLFAKSKGYYAISETMDLTQLKQYNEINKDLYLYPIRKGEIIPMNNIFFTVNMAELMAESYSELDHVASFLMANKGIKIEIGGHTNNKCSSSYCVLLSTDRAKEVVNYLIGKGVDKNQVKYRGYGKERPIDTNETEEGRQKNQRVEFTILEVAN